MIKQKTVDTGKVALDVSLAILAASGAATGNIAIAGLSAIPGAIVASEALKTLLSNQKVEKFALDAPPWSSLSTREWEDICQQVEYHIPGIIESVIKQLGHQRSAPTSLRSPALHRLFVEQIDAQIPALAVPIQERMVTTEYIARALVDRSAETLRPLLASLRDDALVNILQEILLVLDEIRTPSAPATSVTIVPADPVALPPPTPDALLKRKIQANVYDVYICYYEKDEDAVFAIGDQLKAQGTLPWFDAEDARPGNTYREDQEEQIRKIGAAAVFVGKHSIQDRHWSKLQMYAFLDQFVKRGLPVIPVLLADAPVEPDLPPFLGTFTWVDFRKQRPDPLGRLIWGITGKRPVS